MVALNMTVCTSWLQQVMISLISASKPSYSSLSASSKIKTSRFSMPMLREFINRSMILPGVPITTSGLFLSADSCFSLELAPMASAASKLVNLFNFWNSSQICMASSRVGVTTRLRMQPTAATLKQRWMSGMRKAAVLPDPVIELATTSFPEEMTGMASCWMGVGRRQPSSPTAFNRGRISRRSSKDFPLLPSARVRVGFLPTLFLGLSECSTMTFSWKMELSGSGEWVLACFSIFCWSEVCLVGRKESCWMEERRSFSLRDSLGACDSPSKKPVVPWPMPTSSDSLSIVEDNIIIHQQQAKQAFRHKPKPQFALQEARSVLIGGDNNKSSNTLHQFKLCNVLTVVMLRHSRPLSAFQTNVAVIFENQDLHIIYQDQEISMAVNKKVEERLQRRTLYGYARENYYDYIKSQSIPLINHLITPTGVARKGPLRFKLQALIGIAFLRGQPHPTFRYLIRKLVFFEALNHTLKTDYRSLVANQNLIGLNDSNLEGQVKTMVGAVVGELLEMQSKGKYRFDKKTPRREKLRVYGEVVERFREQLRQELMEEAQRQEETARAEGRQMEFIYTKEYVNELVSNVDKIEVLRDEQQLIKYKIFQASVKPFLETALKVDKNLLRLKVNRPSAEVEPLLQNTYELVAGRSANASYRSQAILLVRDIFEQLKQYEKINSTEKTRTVYDCLHPTALIFDQIALTPRLSYQPLVLQLFGLKDRPISVEAKIAFCPTPTPFDYFKSLLQLGPDPESENEDRRKDVRVMLDDPFYGNLQLYDLEKHRMRSDQLEQIEAQKRELQRIKGMILTERFLLLSHYLIQSTECGFYPKINSNAEKTRLFREDLRPKMQSLSYDMSHLSFFLGSTNPNVSGRPFTFAMAQVGDFLALSKEDSVIEGSKFIRTRKYFQTRNLIIREFIRLLVNDKLFGRIYNIKKYIFLYLAISIEILEEARKLAQVERVLPHERRKLRVYLQGALKRQNGKEKNHFGYLQTTFDKIKVYRQRNPTNDYQARFVKEDQMGKKAIGFVDEINRLILELQGCSQLMGQLESKESLSSEQRQAYESQLSRVQQIVRGNSDKVRDILNEFIFSELRLKHKDSPHRYSEDTTRAQKDWFGMYTTRLELLTLLYISMREDNFVTYDTLVMPLFRIDDSDRKLEIPKGTELLGAEAAGLKTVGQLIDSSRLIPRRLIYLATRTTNEELKIYENNLQKAPGRQSYEAAGGSLPSKHKKQ